MEKLIKYIEELLNGPLTNKQKLIIQALAEDDIVVYTPRKTAGETVEEYVEKIVLANDLTAYHKNNIMKIMGQYQIISIDDNRLYEKIFKYLSEIS